MYNFLFVDASQSVSMCVQYGHGYPGFSFCFPWLPRKAEALQSKTQGKNELAERNSVDLALRVRGCAREFKGWLKNDCNAQRRISLFSVSLLFFSWTKSYASIYFSLSIFFYFYLNPPAATWKIEQPHLPCFLHEAGCQCYYLRLLRWTQCIFFLNLSASFNNTAFLSV